MYLQDFGGSGAIASFSNCVAAGSGGAVLAEGATLVVELTGATVVVVELVEAESSSAEAAVVFRKVGNGVVVDGTANDADGEK